MRRMVIGLVVLGVSACFFGCGGGDYSSPKATFQTAFEAMKAGNRDAIAACMEERAQKAFSEMLKFVDEAAKEMPELKESMGGKGLLGQSAEQARKAKVVIGAEKITGDTATLEVTIDGHDQTVSFVRERGAWRIKGPERLPDIAEMRKGMEKMRELRRKLQGVK